MIDTMESKTCKISKENLDRISSWKIHDCSVEELRSLFDILSSRLKDIKAFESTHKKYLFKTPIYKDSLESLRNEVKDVLMDHGFSVN